MKTVDAFPLGDGVRIVVRAPLRRGEVYAMAWTGVVFTTILIPSALLWHPKDVGERIAMWIFAGFTIAPWCILAWMFLGKEVVTARGGQLSIRSEILGIGTTRRFDIARIRDLQVSPRDFSRSDTNDGISLTRGSGQIAFHYAGKEERFGIQISADDAYIVVSALEPYVGHR